MLDISRVGVPMLERVRSRFAENCDDSLVFEDVDAVLEVAKSMVDDTDLRRGIRATSKSHRDQLQRERDIMKSLTEALAVRRMG